MATATLTPQAEMRRMWPGGPLRQWSPVREGGCSMPLDGGGYGGPYECEGCLTPVPGVYRVITQPQRGGTWLCASCKAQATAGRAN